MATTADERTIDYTDRVIQMLTDDHRHVQKLFEAAEAVVDDADQLKDIVHAVCDALTEHAELEEEFFYPALRATDARPRAIEAEIEHDVAKQLIAEIRRLDRDDERYRATLTVLREYVQHHVDEEEGEIFRQAREVRADFEPMYEVLSARADRDQPATGVDAGRATPTAPRRPRERRSPAKARASRSRR